MFDCKIVVTGGSGFIGTNLIDKLILEGFEIINLDINKPLKKEMLNCWRNVDINDFDKFKEIVDQFCPNYIVHLAARTDLEGKILDDYKTNILGVENLMKIAKELPSLKKLIITSSMLVCSGGYYPKNQFDYKPSTIYGESKVLTEKIVWSNKLLCDWAIVRPTSIWGPWFSIPYKNFFDMIISKKYYHVGNRGCTKTYGYVGNSVYQIIRILFSDTLDEINKVYYLGDNPATNIEEWGNEIATELGHKIARMPYPLIKGAAFFGDFLKFFGFNFPMNSFRLHNMTTDNIVDLDKTYVFAQVLPYSRKEGVKETLKWIEKNKV